MAPEALEPGPVDPLDQPAAHRYPGLSVREVEALLADANAWNAMINGSPGMEAAARDVFHERLRQVTGEGWSEGHDDDHGDGSLARAAGCYSLIAAGWAVSAVRELWPVGWSHQWLKTKGGARRMLVKAGALIIAEIERLDRKEKGAAKPIVDWSMSPDAPLVHKNGRSQPL